MRREWVATGFTPAALLAGLLVAGCGGNPSGPPPVQPPPVQPPPEPTNPPTPPTLAVNRILAFGDSMTEGVDQPPFPKALTLALDAGRSQSYPFKLKSAMDSRYTNQSVSVANAGSAGKQAREDRDRFNRAMSDASPELILLLEGANDLNGPLAPGEGVNARVASVVNALEDMVRDATGRGVTVFIATLPPQRPGGAKAGGIEYLPRFNDSVKSMAQKKGAELVDINAKLELSFIGQDGLHPTEAGYQRIAEIWLDSIKARYERAPQ